MIRPSAPPRRLAQLESAIASTQHPIDRACLQGEQALTLARLGRHDEAGDVCARLHAEFDRQPDPRVSVWLALAEGLDAYYRNLSLAGRDRLRRAHALASAARLRQLSALAAAWLAQLDYVQHDLPALGRHLSEALGSAAADDHGVRSRAALVVAQALHWADRLPLALPWYAAARVHAQALGDDATLSALMHNAAWLRGVQARQALLFGLAEAGPAGTAAAMAESAANLDRMVDSRSLAGSLPLLGALLAVDRGEPAAALAVFDAERAVDAGHGLNRLAAIFEADRAWCLLQISAPTAQVQAAAQSAVEAMHQQTDTDDRAITHARLAQVWQALGDASAAEHHRRCATLDWADHLAAQQAMRAAVEPLARSLGGLGSG